MSKVATARAPQSGAEARPGFVFGTAHRPRRGKGSAGRQVVSDADLIAEFLKNNKVKVCAPAYADGAVKESGSYQW